MADPNTQNDPDTVLRTVICDKCEHEFVSNLPCSPLAMDVIRSDQVPTAAETAQYLELLDQETQEIKRYRQEISCRRQIADKLESEMLILEKQTMMRRTFLSASRRFPVEIYDKIFNAACHHDSFSLSLWNARGEVIADPMRLSHVCHRWRRILFSRPRMWTSMSVDIGKVDRDVTGLVQLFLKNSNRLPLRIRCHDNDRQKIGQDDLDDPNFPRYQFGLFGLDIFRMLMREMSRCEELDLGVDWESIDAFLAEPPISQSFPLLHTFRNESSITPTTTTLGNHWFWTSVRRAPRLVNVYAINEGYLGSLPFTRITCLELYEIRVMQGIQMILLVCNNIESLTIHYFVPDSLRAAPAIPLPSLRSLSLTICELMMPSSVDEFLNGFLLPSLSSLTINSAMSLSDGLTRVDAEWPPESFLSVLEQNSDHLETLCLDFRALQMSHESVSRALQLIPNLTSLELVLLGDPTSPQPPTIIQLLSQLTVRTNPSAFGSERSPTVFLPKLTRLQLIERSLPMTFQSAQVILEMLESRTKRRLLGLGTPNVSPITRFRFSFSMSRYMSLDGLKPVKKESNIEPRFETLLPGAEERLRELQVEGMDVEISW